MYVDDYRVVKNAPYLLMGAKRSRIWQKGEAMIRARDLEEVREPT